MQGNDGYLVIHSTILKGTWGTILQRLSSNSKENSEMKDCLEFFSLPWGA